MGLKYVSLNRSKPHVVVMAPALTETSQPNGFSLKSGSLSSPVSLICCNNIEDNLYNIKRKLAFIHNSHFVMNGDIGKIDEKRDIDNLCYDKKHKDVIKEKSDGIHHDEIVKEADYSLLQIGGFMMNSNNCPINRHSTNICRLQKTHESNMDSNAFLKTDVLKCLNSNAESHNDYGGAGDIGQNVDEIMQVIKNMECKGTDIEENLESSLHISDGNDFSGGLSFERELFNDVDMINMCVDDNLGENQLSLGNKDTVIKEKVNEAFERQFKIERKCEWLLRRLKKMQARAMGKQISEEITGLLKHIRNLLICSNISPKSSAFCSLTPIEKENNEPKDLIKRDVNSLLQSLDQSSQQQALSISQLYVPYKYFGAGSCEINRMDNDSLKNILDSILPTFSDGIHCEVNNTTYQLKFQLHVIESGVDSDVTASSSGGESCDEMQCFSNSHQQNLSISKRSSWKWLQDRAAIASRWTWLQAQISDLEYRIRQNNDLNKQIRTAKGCVILDGDNPSKLCDSNIVNGHSLLPDMADKCVNTEVLHENVSRTRPLSRSFFRKRKLLKTSGLFTKSKKTTKLSRVSCGCRPPLSTCALCTGRSNPTELSDDTDMCTLNERIGLLDAAFHPVLSFQCDVSQDLHFDSIMKTSDWQLKAQRLHFKVSNIIRGVENSEDAPLSSHISKKPLIENQRRNYFKKSTAAALSEKIKKKLAKGKKGTIHRGSNYYALERLKARRRFTSLPNFPGNSSQGDKTIEINNAEEENDSESSTSLVVVTDTSPVLSSSPTPHSSKDRGESLRRKRENSYDIDNIVIPYSVAASTRLEKLQYKEILTPKWRILPLEPIYKLESKNNGMIERRDSQGDVEDMAEEIMIGRHEKCEQEEKKKFSTYLKLPNSLSRPRIHRRSDSRAESSEGNTPDPLSPAAVEGGGSPVISPPSTPQPTDVDCSRKRTVSLPLPSCWASSIENITDEIPPYDLRTFPLSEDTYEKMLKIMPPDHPFKVHTVTQNNPSDSEGESRPLTPLTDSTESADTVIDEDPNDPEWGFT